MVNLSGDNGHEITIFNATSGNEIGTSMFHISCSDANMNSPNDCGSQQESGKKDVGGLVNTWMWVALSTHGYLAVSNQVAALFSIVPVCQHWTQ